MQQPYISIDTHSCFLTYGKQVVLQNDAAADRPDVQLYKLAVETIKQLLF